MIEQIFEVKLIVRTNSKTKRTPESVQDALHESRKWLEREDVRQIKAEQVYEQTRG